MTIEITKTSRGFAIGTFTDQYGKVCTIQKSSLATQDCLWLGVDGENRMHLTQLVAGDLVPLLERFSLTGTLSQRRMTIDEHKGTIIDAMQGGYDALDTAMLVHIYDGANGERPEPDCEFRIAKDTLFLAMDTAREFGAFTYLEMEAALCVWECINDWTVSAPKDRERPDWVALREGVGSVELRHASMPLGQWCLKVYDLCTAEDPDFFDGVAYDWEVIPMILSYAKNDEGPVIHAPELPDPTAIAEKVKARHKRDAWFSEARHEAAKQWAWGTAPDENELQFAAAYERGDEPAAFVKWFGEKYDLTPASDGC